MGRIYIEERFPGGDTSLSWDIAHHLFVRHLCGKALIITDNPNVLLAAVRKQWRSIEGRVMRERSSTLNAARIVRLSEVVADMRNARFVAGDPVAIPDGRVYFTGAKHVAPVAQHFPTIYVATHLYDSLHQALRERMPYHGLLVIYRMSRPRSVHKG